MGIGQGLCIHLSMKTGKKQSSCSELSLRKILEDPERLENAWDKVEMDSTSPCLPHSDHIQVLYDQCFFNASVILMACVTFPTRSEQTNRLQTAFIAKRTPLDVCQWLFNPFRRKLRINILKLLGFDTQYIYIYAVFPYLSIAFLQVFQSYDDFRQASSQRSGGPSEGGQGDFSNGNRLDYISYTIGYYYKYYLVHKL